MPAAAALICGHGSRDPDGLREFAALVAAVRPLVAPLACAAGHLEFAAPTIAEALAAVTAAGASRIAMVPAMLLAGRHLGIDLPRERDGFAAGHPGIALRLGPGLVFDHQLKQAARDRIAAAIGDDAPGESLLVIVGRGSGDAAANRAVAALARRLAGDFDFAAAEVAFAGLAEPATAAVLARAARDGRRRVVVLPYFLFTGILVKRIGAAVEAAAQRFPRTGFGLAAPLGGHPAVAASVAAQARALIAAMSDV